MEKSKKSELLSKIGQNIKKVRNERGLSQQDLAHSINRDKNSIYRIEKGLVNPSLTLIIKICHILNIELNDLIFEINIKKYLNN